VNVPNLTPQLLRSRFGKVCVSIAGDAIDEMLEKAVSAIRETPFLEFRLDYLDKPLLALPRLKTFLAANPTVTAIATCRRQSNGGRFSGSVAAEIEVLSRAVDAGFHLVDLELESAEAAKKADLQSLRGLGAALLISHHDFHATKDVEDTCKRIGRF
jgi:3-dehydroquinate dehydratase/shikimate dehydrogenase